MVQDNSGVVVRDRPFLYRLDDDGSPIAVAGLRMVDFVGPEKRPSRLETDDVDAYRAWARWYASSMDQRRLALTEIQGSDGQRYAVSTVFTGWDYGWVFGGPSILWQTMISPLDEHGALLRTADWMPDAVDGVVRRYASRQGALDGHTEMVAFARDVPETTRGDVWRRHRRS